MAGGDVDIIIAAWNRADTIERAVASVIDEPETRSVILVDDASTDDTSVRAAGLDRGDGRLRLIRQDQNLGPSAARNRALAVATAPWIAVLDGDDFMEPGRLGRLLSQSGEQDFVADDLIQIAEGAAHGRPLLGTVAPSAIDLGGFVTGNINRRGAVRQEMGFLKPIMRRTFLAEHGLRYDESLRLGEDYVLYARALAAGARFRLLPACGYVSVLRGDSLSGRHGRPDLEALRTADRALLALPNLSPTERQALRRHCRQLSGKIQWLEVIEAVKQRDPVRFLRGFTLSPIIAAEIALRLAEQVALRSGLIGHRGEGTRDAR
jgi:succinoglycan biosynthesis protein ExoU